jgi:hypothetical protein
LLELHSQSPTDAADVWSNDGIDLSFESDQPGGYKPYVRAAEVLTPIARKRAGQALVLYWLAGTQGLFGGSAFVAPRRREFVADSRAISTLNKKLRRQNEQNS